MAMISIVFLFELCIGPQVPPSSMWAHATSARAVAQAPVAPSDTADIVEDGDPGVTPPRVLKAVKPNYTSKAMNARIEGLVGLEAVVERDGTVSNVRILHPLDPETGLDTEAIRTVQRWRFAPARKNGSPVRCRIVVEMAFSLRGSVTQPALEWPDGFLKRSGNLKKVAAGFTSQSLSAQGLRINVLYPADWTLNNAPAPDALITVQKQTDHGLQRVSVFASAGMAPDIVTPLSESALRSVADYVKKQIADDPNGAELLRVGQVWTYDRQWIWAATRQRVPPTPGDMNRLSPIAFEEMRVWTFTSTEARHEVRVVCSVYIPPGLSKNERDASLLRATADFQVILDRLTIEN